MFLLLIHTWYSPLTPHLQFIKTSQFLAVRRQYEVEFDRFDHEEAHGRNPSHPPGLDANGEEIGGAYMTVSTHASEREQRDRQGPDGAKDMGGDGIDRPMNQPYMPASGSASSQSTLN
jgi:hypothetical protein